MAGEQTLGRNPIVSARLKLLEHTLGEGIRKEQRLPPNELREPHKSFREGFDA